MQEKEIWKDVVGYEGIYTISNIGNIKSLRRKGVAKDRLMKKNIHRGYVCVTMTKNKKPKAFFLHRLLFAHFKGDLLDCMVIDHIDNVKTNNSLSNLQQITPRENATKDRFRQKTTSKCLGVSWCKVKSKWRATIYDGKKRKHIGYYKKEIDAYNAYKFEKELLLNELKKDINSLT